MSNIPLTRNGESLKGGGRTIPQEEFPEFPAPIGKLLGLTLTKAGCGQAAIEFEAGPRYANPMGTLHGGVNLDNHPTVIEIRRRNAGGTTVLEAAPLGADLLKRVCLEAGADDVGLVEIDRPELVAERVNIEAAFPHAKTLVSFVCRMNRDPIRSPARSVANLEFHQTTDRVNEVEQRIVAALHERGFRAINPAAGFPMEMDRFPDRIWVVSEKTVAVAAGLGQMGIHRNVIHPIFGNFILLGAVITDAEVTEHARPIDFNPCLECKLCVAACPVGAIGDDGNFNFSACFTHNYREFMGGFIDWVETIAGSDGATAYRRKVTDSETASIWQTLSFGANYKAAYCMAVCPAGEEVISPFLADRKNYLREVVKPLQAKVERVYVVPGSDAETHVRRRFPHKKPRLVSNGLRPTSIKALFTRLSAVFQREASSGLDATYLFKFTGEENCAFTVEIRNKTLVVHSGQIGTPDLSVAADSRTWLEFVNKQRGILWALITMKIRLNGPLRLLKAFGRCFLRKLPSSTERKRSHSSLVQSVSSLMTQQATMRQQRRWTSSNATSKAARRCCCSLSASTMPRTVGCPYQKSDFSELWSTAETFCT